LIPWSSNPSASPSLNAATHSATGASGKAARRNASASLQGIQIAHGRGVQRQAGSFEQSFAFGHVFGRGL
jgi:hypothetical protein